MVKAGANMCNMFFIGCDICHRVAPPSFIAFTFIFKVEQFLVMHLQEKLFSSNGWLQQICLNSHGTHCGVALVLFLLTNPYHSLIRKFSLSSAKLAWSSWLWTRNILDYVNLRGNCISNTCHSLLPTCLNHVYCLRNDDIDYIGWRAVYIKMQLQHNVVWTCEDIPDVCSDVSACLDTCSVHYTNTVQKDYSPKIWSTWTMSAGNGNHMFIYIYLEQCIRCVMFCAFALHSMPSCWWH